jgi:hypothetical protein
MHKHLQASKSGKSTECTHFIALVTLHVLLYTLHIAVFDLLSNINFRFFTIFGYSQ